MKKEEYIKKYDELTKKMEEVRKELLEVKKEYIASNTTYPIGTKLKLTFPKRPDSKKVEYGIVRGYEISVNNEVRPVLAKMKKDGTAHPNAQQYCHWWEHPIVEIAE